MPSGSAFGAGSNGSILFFQFDDLMGHHCGVIERYALSLPQSGVPAVCEGGAVVANGTKFRRGVQRAFGGRFLFSLSRVSRCRKTTT